MLVLKLCSNCQMNGWNTRGDWGDYKVLQCFFCGNEIIFKGTEEKKAKELTQEQRVLFRSPLTKNKN